MMLLDSIHRLDHLDVHSQIYLALFARHQPSFHFHSVRDNGMTEKESRVDLC